MKLTLSGRVAIVFTLCSMLVGAVAHRHIAWDGMVMGRGGSKIRGLMEMVGGKVAGTTSVEVTYSGDTPGATRSWHVHRGSCAKGAAILGIANAYTPLRVDAKGAVAAKATLRVTLPDSGSFYLDIHESPVAGAKLVACGELLLAE